MPTRSPTSPGLGVQVIKPLAISPGPASKPDNQPQPLFRREREKKEGGKERNFFLCCIQGLATRRENAISLQTATPNTLPPLIIPRVFPFCHRTLVSACHHHQGDRGHLCGLQPEQEPGSEGLYLQRQAFPSMAPSTAEEGGKGTRIPHPTLKATATLQKCLEGCSRCSL